jgi:hypothetical protein
MNCCNEYGQCTQGPGCPAREAPMNADLARRANERIRRLEEGRAHLLTLADTPGNWWDALPWYGRLGTVVGAVLTVGLIVGYA